MAASREVRGGGWRRAAGEVGMMRVGGTFLTNRPNATLYAAALSMVAAAANLSMMG